MIDLALTVAAFLFLALVGLVALLIGGNIFYVMAKGTGFFLAQIVTAIRDSFKREFDSLSYGRKLFVKLLMWGLAFGFCVLIVQLTIQFRQQ
jgi:hypothetical protein